MVASPFLSLVNMLMFRKQVDYVLFTFAEPPPSLPEPRPPWWMRSLLGASPPKMSLYELDQAFQRIAADSKTKGVILHLRRGKTWGLADLQSLRESIFALRKSGKRVIAYSSTGYDVLMYYLASAADETLLQPMSDINVCGLTHSFPFLKNSFASVGIEFDWMASHPYKTAVDHFMQDSPSKEFNKVQNKYLDSKFDLFVDGIAEGRNMKPSAVRSMIDKGCFLDHEALESGYIEGIVNEESLPHHLGVKKILTWDQAKSRYSEPWWQQISKLRGPYVPLVRIEGVIVPGESRSLPVEMPLIGSKNFVGDLTVVQQVRRLTKDKRAGAMILYVNSPGGDGPTTNAIASAIQEFNRERPVIVYMNNVAASGGYLVSIAGRWIVARPGTLTGSVGAAFTRKIVDEGLYSKLHVNRVTYTRGENASMILTDTPYTDAQRKRQREMLDYYYNQVESLVGQRRGMTQEQLDAACQGRIWTGKQAIDCGLVDELGGLDTALKKARELAGLPDNTPLLIPSFKDKRIIGPELVNPAAFSLNHMNEIATTLISGNTLFLMPLSVKSIV